jgi:hypothetical protein
MKKTERQGNSHRGYESNETPAPEHAAGPGTDQPGNEPDEDLTSGSEGGGPAIGLGRHKPREHGSPARPMRDGH